MDAKHLFKHKKRVPPAAWICLTLAVLLVGTGAIFAKYRSEMKKQAEMIAAGFHISSDHLEEGGATYSVSHLAQNPIVIKLYNYEKENIAQISQVDMKYKVTVNGGFATIQNETNNTLTPNDGGEYEMGISTDKAEHTLTITPNSSLVTVTVTTTSPYKKTLTAKFELTASSLTAQKKLKNMGSYCILTIYSNQQSGEKTLKWPEGLIPDNTNAIMRNWLDTAGGHSGTFTMNDYTTYELIFFNPNGVSGLTADSFSLS